MKKFTVFTVLALILFAICNVIQSEGFEAQSDIVVAGKLNNVEIEGRVAGGNQATVSQFPYNVAINMVAHNDDIYVCGGTLVKYNWVITTAFCIDGCREVYLFLGTSHINGTGNIWKSPSIPSKHLFKHPKYNRDKLTDNLGMIYLEKATESLLDHQEISVLSLPTRADASFNIIGANGTFAGYGRTNIFGDWNEQLHYAVLTFINNTVCREAFPNYTTPRNLCVKTVGGVSPCDDAGSGIAVEVAPGRKVLMGVSSFTISACTIGYPAVFEEIIGNLDWIEETFRNSSPAIGLSIALLNTMFIVIFTFN